MSLLRVTVVPSPYQVREKRLYYGSLHALGIGAASFASGNGNKVRGRGRGRGRDLGTGRASKDIAESPTAIAGTPKDNS